MQHGVDSPDDSRAAHSVPAGDQLDSSIVAASKASATGAQSEAGSSDFADDIVPSTLPQHIGNPRRNTFEPWHRVHKEYVRREQWNKLAINVAARRWKSLLGTIQPAGATPSISPRPLNCLVLPGEDLLDVRALWEDMAQDRFLIRYLGFNYTNASDQQGTRLHIANNAVVSLEGVARESKVVKDRFEALRSPGSMAMKYVREHGPFHLVNLDFCGTICPNTQGDTSAYYTAIHNLLAYQFKEQRTEWLLYVTTEVESPVVSQDDFERLFGAARQNALEYPEFAAELNSNFGFAADQIDFPLNISSLTGDKVLKLFGVTFGKWILKLCQSAEPKWSMHLRSSLSYVINQSRNSIMLAVAFEFSPNLRAPEDSTGVSGAVVNHRQYADEKECALGLIRRMATTPDIDTVLAGDAALRDKLFQSQLKILEAAGYDGDAYREWVAQGEPSHQNPQS